MTHTSARGTPWRITPEDSMNANIITTLKTAEASLVASLDHATSQMDTLATDGLANALARFQQAAEACKARMANAAEKMAAIALDVVNAFQNIGNGIVEQFTVATPAPVPPPVASEEKAEEPKPATEKEEEPAKEEADRYLPISDNGNPNPQPAPSKAEGLEVPSSAERVDALPCQSEAARQDHVKQQVAALIQADARKPKGNGRKRTTK